MSNEIKYTINVTQDDTNPREQLSHEKTGADHSKSIADIEERLDIGDVWAWACIEVVASLSGVSESSFIGGCCYKDEEDFKKCSDYYEDKCKEAKEELIKTLKAASEAFKTIERDQLDEEEKAIFENSEKCPHCDHELDYFDPEITEDKKDIQHDRDCKGCGATFCLTYALVSVDVEEPTWQEHYMSNEDAFNSYLEGFFEGDKHKLKAAYESDECAINEGWSCYTDGLCKDNQISGKQYHEMPSIDEMF